MQYKQVYNVANKVSSTKSATTFGDLPDWLSVHTLTKLKLLMEWDRWMNDNNGLYYNHLPRSSFYLGDF